MEKNVPTTARSQGDTASALAGRLFAPIGVALVVLTAGIFAGVAGHDFVDLDDPIYVTSNPYVQRGLTLENLRWVTDSVVAANWHPLTMLSHVVDWELYGDAASGHHLTNLAIHVVNAFLLFVLFRELLDSVWTAAFAAALFAWHPLRVESVAWVSERKDVLSTMFWILTTLAYVYFVRRGGWRWYAALVAGFIAGLLSKPMLVTLPFTLLLLDYWPLKRFDDQRLSATARGRALRLIGEKLPLFALSLAMSVTTFFVQRSHGAMDLDIGWRIRVENAVHAYTGYLGKFVWPTELILPYLRGDAPTAAQTLLSAAGLVLVTAVAVVRRRDYPYATVGWLWYLGTLVPVIGIVQVGPQTMADRYTYVPMIGISMVVACAMRELASSLASGPRRFLIGATIIWLAVLAGLTLRQTAYWRDTETRFRHTLSVVPENRMAHALVGIALEREGRIEEAEPHFRAALASLPTFGRAHLGLGQCLLARGYLVEALDHYRTAQALGPETASENAYLAEALALVGERASAEHHFRRALAFNPLFAEEMTDLEARLALTDPTDDVLALYRAALKRQPDEALVQLRLARILATSPSERHRNGAEAVLLARAAVDALGDDAEGLDTLAAAYAEAGRFNDAIRTAARADELARNSGDEQLSHEIQLHVASYRRSEPLRERPGATTLRPRHEVAAMGAVEADTERAEPVP